MSETIFYSVPIEDLLQKIRAIVKEEMKHEEKQEEKLLSTAEACKLFQPAISRVTLHKWTSDGHLKRYDIGSRVYYKKSEILESAKSLKKYKSK